jgi:tRNA modification GTPase
VTALAGRAPPARRAALRSLRDPATGERLDEALVLALPGPGSFTGEDVGELQIHGSPAACRAVLDALARLDGLRAAEPGEFTRRALLNGRLDLAQVEGLGDLIAAETRAQQRQALRLMEGVVSRQARTWRDRLVGALAQIEAGIDFADEELPGDLLASVRADVAAVQTAMQRELAGSAVAERLRDGFEVALVGPPNVGKSTLLNALAGREAALTSEVEGTTRDVIEVRMDLGGLPFTLLDMAGLREAEGLEGRGVARARARAEQADLRVFLLDAPEDGRRLGVQCIAGDVMVLAKADLRQPGCGLAVSGMTGEGIDSLLGRIEAELAGRVATAGSLSHQRQRQAVERAAAALHAASAELARAAPQTELAAEELRAALRALDFLVGKVDVEAVLDAIFARFCLGK